MPPLATKAREKTFCLNSPSPSVVVTALPAIFFIGVTHESTALLSMSTAQQPHAACGEQPSLGEMIPWRSRR